MIETTAPAKINLTLRVLGKREDGFHEIETLIVPLALADRLTIEAAAEWSFYCDDPTVPGDERNLVVRAARLFFAETGIDPAGRVRLMKAIPHGAGLGGGSSDAAATLRMLNQFHGVDVSREKLVRMAAELGSDVPVFFRKARPGAGGAARSSSRRTSRLHCRCCCSSPNSASRRHGPTSSGQESRVLEGVSDEAQEFPWGRLENRPRAPGFSKNTCYWRAMKEWLRRQPETAGALMSGSGSTMFAVLREAGNTLAASRRCLANVARETVAEKQFVAPIETVGRVRNFEFSLVSLYTGRDMLSSAPIMSEPNFPTPEELQKKLSDFMKTQFGNHVSVSTHVSAEPEE